MRKEGETTSLDYDLETRTLIFESKYCRFEQRVIDYPFEDKVYTGVIRLTGHDENVFGSLYFPDIQVSPDPCTPEDFGVHKEILERALVIYGDDKIKRLINRNSTREHSWGDQITSKTADDKRLARRMEIDEVPKIAEAVMRYDRFCSSRVNVYGGLYGLGIAGVVASVPLFALVSSTAGIISSGLGCLIYAGMNLLCEFQKRKLMKQWEYGSVLYEHLEVIQDIEEQEIKKETRDLGFHQFFHGISSYHLGYRKGLCFTFIGPRETVEEKISALLGKAPLRRIKYPDEIKYEQEELQEQIRKNMGESRKGKNCLYCKGEFVLGDTKKYGQIYMQDGDQYIAIEGDLHPECNERSQEVRDSKKPVKRRIKC